MKPGSGILLSGLLLAFAMGFPASAQSPEASRELERGRPDLALPHTKDISPLDKIQKLEVLCELNEFTEADQVLEQLETLKHGSFPSPHDFRFYFYRGKVTQAKAEYELARKNFRESHRRAKYLEQRLRAQLALCWLDIIQDKFPAAQKRLDRIAANLAETTAPKVLGEALELQARLQDHSGSKTAAILSNSAARSIYRAGGFRRHSTDALYTSQAYLVSRVQFEERYDIAHRALKNHLREGNLHSAIGILRSHHILYYRLADKRELLADDFAQVLSASRGTSYSEEAQLAWANYQLDIGRESPELVRSYEALIQSEDSEIRCLAHQGRALTLGRQGERAKALLALRTALHSASPQLKKDSHWRVAPPFVRYRIAFQEKARHNYEAAYQLGREALAAAKARDWLPFRIDAHYLCLMSAIEAGDLNLAKKSFRESLKEIEELPNAELQADAFTTILASLLLNQSVEGDVIDPSALILGEYPEIAQSLLEDSFRTPPARERYLRLFDDWSRELQVKDDKGLRAYAPLYKGLFLEALGRYREAKIALNSSLDLAQQGSNPQGQMLSLLLLGRIQLFEGRTQEAVGLIAEAARISDRLNPIAARFYWLVAAGAEERWGDPGRAQAAYDKVKRLKPERAWPAHYGQARLHLRKGEYKEALDQLRQAWAKLEGTERRHSRALVLAAQAKAQAGLGSSELATSLFSRSLKSLSFSPALAQVTLDYSHHLREQNQPRKALEVLGATLDELKEHQASIDAGWRALFEPAVSLALELGENEKALHYLGLARSSELLNSVDLDQFASRDSRTQQLCADLKSLRLKLNNLGQKKEETETRSEREALGRQLATTRGEFFNTLDQLRNREPDFENLVQITGSQLSAIQGLLSEKSALVEYFPAQDKLYLFVVTRQNFSIRQLDLPRTEIQRQAQELLKLCQDPKGSEGRLQTLSVQLYESLIAPAEDDLHGVDTLRLVPSGPIWDVPFSVLRSPRGKVLALERELSYLSSAEILKILQRREEGLAIEPALLVSGSSQLQGAQREVLALSKMFPDSATLGALEASAASFRDALVGKRLLHIASHSYVSRQSGESYISLGNDRLPLQEIYGLKLEPGSTVVLSSCQSGVGSTIPGKELTSLATAFSVAGASTVISSRWPIDDRISAQFFEKFYNFLSAGKSRAQALRLAQAEVAEKHSHPYYWAAFSLSGDPR